MPKTKSCWEHWGEIKGVTRSEETKRKLAPLIRELVTFLDCGRHLRKYRPRTKRKTIR